MNRAILSVAIIVVALSVVPVVECRTVAAHTGPSRYRLGSAPKAEFKTGGKSFKIDPKAKAAQHVRTMRAEEFDPLRRHERIEEFYRHHWREHYEEHLHRPWLHCGPFRSEFVYWTYEWPIAWRVRWARHHRHFIDEALWAQWMANAEFAAEFRKLDAENEPIVVGYLPPELESTSPVAIYNDEFLNAAYNPVPFLAVMNLKSLKPDAGTDWIGKVTAESLTSKLSTVPGMFLAEEDQVQTALAGEPKTQTIDTADPGYAAHVGKRMDLQQVVVGSYAADGDKVLFNLRLVDVETGRVLNGISNAVPRDHLLDSLPEMANTIAGWLTNDSTDGPPTTPGAPAPLAPMRIVLPAIFSHSETPIKRTFTKDETYSGTLSFTAADGPYQLSANLSPEKGSKHNKIDVGPGSDVRGGNLHFGSGGGHVEISGSPENPAIFRNVEFDQYLGGSLTAHYAIFQNCSFRKAGAYYSRSGHSSKWELDHCLIEGSSTFKSLSHVDYGFRFSDCTFSEVTFPEIGIPGSKDKPVDVMHSLRVNWNEMDRCRFDSCTIPPTVLWCAQASNFTRCKFIPGRAFESDTATEVKAYVSDTTGDAADKVEADKPPARAAVHIIYATQPFDVFSFRNDK